MKIERYKNSFYSKNNPYSKEYIYPYEESIYEYKDFYIFKNVRFCLDIVRLIGNEWLCVSQVGSIRYAKAFIDNGCKHGNYK